MHPPELEGEEGGGEGVWGEGVWTRGGGPPPYIFSALMRFCPPGWTKTQHFWAIWAKSVH